MSYDPAIPQLIEALRGVLSQVAEPIHVLRTILEQAVIRTEADRGVFVEVDRSGGMQYRVLHQFDPAELAGRSGSYSRTIFSEVLRSGESVLVENALADQRYGGSESIQELKLVSVLSVPIKDANRVAAIVHLERDRVGHFTPGHRDLLRTLLDVAAPVLETLRAGNRVLEDRDRLRDVARLAQQELEENREILSRDWSFGRFVGRSAEVRALEDLVRKVAASELPILIEGETGTGKSLLARILHYSGPRAKRPFVTVFCPTLERGMVETELFGHRRGAFTGAVSDRIGKVQAADRGTLFFDEVGELPAEIQPKLLRLLHEKAYERVGDPQERTADVRVIAATNKNLAAEVRAGRFRLDLYERLRFAVVRVPPVRERRDDIPTLLRHALDRYEATRWAELSDDAAKALIDSDYLWPGNVREIEQLAARLALDSRDAPISREEIERHLRQDGWGIDGPSESLEARAAPGGGLPDQVVGAEKAILEKALRDNPALTRAELAAKLRISERALYKKLRLFGLGG